MNRINTYLIGTPDEMLAKRRQSFSELPQHFKEMEMAAKGGSSEELTTAINSARKNASEGILENERIKVGTVVYTTLASILAGLVPVVGIPLAADGLCRSINMCVYDRQPSGLVGTLRSCLTKH